MALPRDGGLSRSHAQRHAYRWAQVRWPRLRVQRRAPVGADPASHLACGRSSGAAEEIESVNHVQVKNRRLAKTNYSKWNHIVIQL